MIKSLNVQKKHLESGFAALFISIIVLLITVGTAISITVLTVGEYKISSNILNSSQSFYAAEAGIEDALLRLKKHLDLPSSYNLSCGEASSIVEISQMIGGSRTINSSGNVFNRIKKVQAIYSLSHDQISFYYGVQIGDGGMTMGNNSRIKGNVFSNGSVIASSGKGYIDNSIVVAKNGNRIEGLGVLKDALVHTCENSTVSGELTYVSGGSVVNCQAGEGIKTQANEILPQDLPITQTQINEWENEAAVGGILNQNYTLDLGAQASLGPIQIGTSSEPKNLVIDNNAHLKITGTIYVTGYISVSNNGIIELDNQSYGSAGGVVIADGKISVNNNGILRGTLEPGSYILILSTNNSLDPASPAISINNNSEGAIFYTTSGLVFLGNNVNAREVTGYKLAINNNAIVQYESGLEHTFFSSGTGGGWKIVSWKEVK